MTTIRTPDDEVDTPGFYYPPFRENWWYEGQTYAGHSDASVDWNRRTKTGGWLDDTGDPVYAAADGTVAEVDKGDGLVLLNHWGGLYRTEYRHMTDIKVQPGDKVQRGDRIGSIGNVAGDGRSFGAHLHHVHYRRDDTTKPWRRVRMRFYDQPVEVSVTDSDTRPDSWNPPTPVMLQGPPPKATWESAFRASQKALAKSEAATAAQKAQTTLAADERDQARRELASSVETVKTQDTIIRTQGQRIAELEAAMPQDCTEAVKAERKRVVDALVSGFDLLATSIR